jgi:enoyl-CoA hydratase
VAGDVTLAITRDGACGVWTIDRPKAKNALDQATLNELLAAVDEAALDRTLRAVVLTGAGDAFVSGGDLRELRDATTNDDAERFSAAGADLCAKLEALAAPVIAALPGPAFGGGAELAVACDMRIADARARISFKQVRLGVTTAWGTIPRLVALVGRGAAARLLYTAREMSAADAKACGFVDEVVPDGSCLETALAWAQEISLGSPEAIAQMKALLRTACEAGPRIAADERRRFVDTWTGRDHTEAMDAYFARRPPVWTVR